MNAVWVPLGAGASPHALPLPWMPLLALNVQPMPCTLFPYTTLFRSTGISKLGLTSEDGGGPELTTCDRAELIDPRLAEHTSELESLINVVSGMLAVKQMAVLMLALPAGSATEPQPASVLPSAVKPTL